MTWTKRIYTAILVLILPVLARPLHADARAVGPGALKCIRIDTYNHAGGQSFDLKTRTRSKIQTKSKLVLSLDPSKCDKATFPDPVAGQDESVLVVRVIVSKSFDSKDETDEEQILSFTRKDVDDGHQLTLASRHFRQEGEAFFRVQARVVKRSDVKAKLSDAFPSESDPAPAEITLAVLDREIVHAFGYRATVPFFFRLGVKKDDPDKFAIGVATSLLVYPVRWTWVANSFARNLALEGTFGAAKSVLEPKQDRRFYTAGFGVSYAGLVGLGAAWDVSASEFYGLYANVTLFSEKGLFGLVPVTN